MISKSIKGRSTSEIKNALTHSMEDGFKPTLAIVFCSISQDRKAICQILDKEGIAIYGSTTNGEFIDEETEKKSTVILLMDIIMIKLFLLIFMSIIIRDLRKVY